MQFCFHCLVIRHASGRVTVTPLELPDLAVHATTLEAATEELALAIDDRITRAHPGRLARFCQPGGGELRVLSVPALPVWDASQSAPAPLKLTALVTPGPRPFTEVRVPRLETRLWLEGKDVDAQAVELLGEHLRALSPSELLALRQEGPETTFELKVEVAPTPLSRLRRRELGLSERPPPRARGDGDDEEPPDEDDWEDRRRSRAEPRARKPPPTPTLDRVGVAWHELAKDGALDPAYEREALVSRIRGRLLSKDPEPLVLVGPSGTGKTAVLQELARQLGAERPFFFLDGARLIAGEGFFGDWQQQVLECLREAREARALVAIGHVGDLLDAGKSAHSDQNVSQLLLPALASRELAFVGEATPEEWARVERRNQSFARAFSALQVEEPAPEATLTILRKVSEGLLGELGVPSDSDALEEVLALCRRFRPYGSLLGNAVAFLRRCLASRAHARAVRLSRGDVVELFSSESGIPPVLLRDDLPLDPAGVRAFLSERVMGQQAAVERVADVVSVIKAGLSDLRRPIGVLLFAGPTGVGKTELSKALAELVFSSRERLVRLDMGEYAGPDALARLLGEPGAPGHLTGAVRRQPFCVVLLDEIEKAHPAVFDALLGVLGEGRLTDADGRLTDFRNAVIVMTSNLGADTFRRSTGFSGPADDESERRSVRNHYLAEARRFFRPELFNRLDDVVVFSPLGAVEIRSIVSREVENVRSRAGFHRHDVLLEVSAPALQHLADRGLDPRYGARPLKRTLERELVVPVAEYLALHPVGGPTRLSFEREPEPGERAPGLSLRAEALGGGEEGVSRQAILEVFERASGLRAEVRAWTRSPPMGRLREELAFFERASRQPSFWSEHGLAEESARKAAAARTLDAQFRELTRQVEAAEELIFEAYYQRSVASAEELGAELRGASLAFESLKERLFASLFPLRGSVTLILVPGKGAWPWAAWLAGVYKRWGNLRALKLSASTAVFVKPDDRPAARRRDPDASWNWIAKWPQGGEQPTPWPGAVAITFTGGEGLMLLAAEHGVHRFMLPGASGTVKVLFEPERRSPSELGPLGALEKRLPNQEIRRVWPERPGHPEGRVSDLRTGTEHGFGDSGLELADLLSAYMHLRIFGEQED